MHACDGVTVQLLRRDFAVLLVLKSEQLIANEIWEFCHGYE